MPQSQSIIRRLLKSRFKEPVYWWLVFGICLAIIVVAVFKDFIFQDRYYLFHGIACDTYDFSYPYIHHIARCFTSFGLPKWSFSFGMGQNLLPFSLSDPFDLLLFLGGEHNVLAGLFYKELAKIVVGGLLFYKYLQLLGYNGYTRTIGALSFAFCGFMIVGGMWYRFSAEVVMMGLLLVSFELLYIKGRWQLFPFAIFIIAVSQPFNLYPYGLFLFSYSLLRCYQTGAFTIKSTFSLTAKMLGLGVLGILLAAPMLAENIAQLIESPRGSGTVNYTHELSSIPVFSLVDRTQMGTFILRLFSNNIMGAGSGFKGWHNFLEAPLLYTGIPTLLLFLQVFAIINRKHRVFLTVFLLLWVMPVVFPYFRYAFWFFSGDYYRAFSFFIAMILLFGSLMALNHIIEKKTINVKLLLYTFFGLIGLLLFYRIQGSLGEGMVKFDVWFMCVLLLVLYTSVLLLMTRFKHITRFKYAFLLLFVFELIWSNRYTLNRMDSVLSSFQSEKIGYDDYSVEAIKYIKSIDSSFYRIDKTYYHSERDFFMFNDAMIQDYRGTCCYSSFNQLHYVQFLQLLGITDNNAEEESRWSLGLVKRPIPESLNRVKYFLTKVPVSSYQKTVFDSIAHFGDVTVYRLKFTLPYGFTYKRYCRKNLFKGLNNNAKDCISLNACVVEDKYMDENRGLTEYQLTDSTKYELPDSIYYQLTVNELIKDTLTIKSFKETELFGTISTTENKLLYLSIPYDDGWKLYVDGQPANKVLVFGGMTGVYLPKGQHTVKMQYELRCFWKGLYFTGIGVLIYLGMVLFIRKKPEIYY